MASQGPPAGGFVLGSDNIQPGTTYSFLSTLTYTGPSPFTLVSPSNTVNSAASSQTGVGAGARPSQTSSPITSSVAPPSQPPASTSRLFASRSSISSPLSSSLIPAVSRSSAVSSSQSAPPSSSSTSSNGPTISPSNASGATQASSGAAQLTTFVSSSAASTPSSSSSFGPPLAAGAPSSSSGGTSKGVIIGAVIGSVLGLLLLLLLLFLLLLFLRRRRRNRLASKDQHFNAKPDDTFFTSAATSKPGTSGGDKAGRGGFSEKGTPYSERSAISDRAPALPPVNTSHAFPVDHASVHNDASGLAYGAAGLAGVGMALTSRDSHEDEDADSLSGQDQYSMGGAARGLQEEPQAGPSAVAAPATAAAAALSERQNPRQEEPRSSFGHRRSRNSESSAGGSSIRGSVKGIWPFSTSRGGGSRPSTSAKSIVDDAPPVLPDLELSRGVDPLFGSVAARKKAGSPDLFPSSPPYPSGVTGLSGSAGTGVESVAPIVASGDPSSQTPARNHPILEPGTLATAMPAAALSGREAEQKPQSVPSPHEQPVAFADSSDPSYFAMQSPPQPKPRSPLRALKMPLSQPTSATNSRPLTPANQMQDEGLLTRPGTTPPLQTFLLGSSSKKNAQQPGEPQEHNSPVSPTRSFRGFYPDQTTPGAASPPGSPDTGVSVVEVGTAVPIAVPSRNSRRITRTYVHPTAKETDAFDFQFEDIRAGPYAVRSEPNTAYQTARHSQDYLPYSRDDNDEYKRGNKASRGSFFDSEAGQQRGSWLADDDEDQGNMPSRPSNAATRPA